MIGRIISMAFAMLFCLVAHRALAQQASQVSQADINAGVIGTILEIQGTASVTKENAQTATTAAADMPIYLNDTVQTGADSRVFILFIDNTELTLSENTNVKIDDFVFDPDDNTGNKALYSVMMGIFQYTSGLIGKKENPDVRIETPVGSIGIRGTDFIAGEIDGEFSVAVNEGQVAFTTDAGEEVVSKGEGTSVKNRRSMPARAKVWKPEKLQRIASTVHLKRREFVRQKIATMQKRQKTMRENYKNHMKTYRHDGKWERPARPDQNGPQRDNHRKALKQREQRQQYRTPKNMQNLQQNRNGRQPQRQQNPRPGRSNK